MQGREAGEESGQVPSLLAERPRSECARSMRAVEGNLGHSLQDEKMNQKERGCDLTFPVLLQRSHSLMANFDVPAGEQGKKLRGYRGNLAATLILVREDCLLYSLTLA